MSQQVNHALNYSFEKQLNIRFSAQWDQLRFSRKRTSARSFPYFREFSESSTVFFLLKYHQIVTIKVNRIVLI